MGSPIPSALSPAQPNSNNSPSPSPTQNPPQEPQITPTASASSPHPELTTEPILPLNHHPMITRSKQNISKPKIPTDGTIRYPLPKALITATTESQITSKPTCFTTASKNPKWQQVMNLEFDALIKNNTWSLVPPTPNQNLVGCKWVFHINP
jgi:hypothetical protein